MLLPAQLLGCLCGAAPYRNFVETRFIDLLFLSLLVTSNVALTSDKSQLALLGCRVHTSFFSLSLFSGLGPTVNGCIVVLWGQDRGIGEAHDPRREPLPKDDRCNHQKQQGSKKPRVKVLGRTSLFFSYRCREACCSHRVRRTYWFK